MRVLVRVLAAAAVLFVLALVALWLALPRVLGSEAMRARLESAAHDATGRAVRWDALDVGLLPPRLVVEGVRIEDAAGGAPRFAAERIALEVALLPLLARAVVVDSLRLSGATARLVRTEQGIELPFLPPEAEESEASAPREPSGPKDEGLALAVRQVALERSEIVLEDRTLDPAASLALRDLEARVRGESLAGPVHFELSGALASGGTLRGEGRAQSRGEVRFDLELAGVDLAVVAPYLDAGQTASGAATGKVAFQGGSGRPERLNLDLTVEAGRLEAEDLSVSGRFAVRADLTRQDAQVEGPFEVDATHAEVRYGGAFTKPPGQAATASGRLVAVDGGLKLSDTHVRVRQVEADVWLETGARTRATVKAPAFDVAGLGELLPALAPLAPTGRVAVPELRVSTAPLALDGTLELPELVLHREGDPPLALRGRFEARGDRLRSRDLVASVSGQELGIDVVVAELASAPRFRADLSGERIDTKALLAAYDAGGGKLSGPLRISGRLQGPLAGKRPFLETVGGRLQAEIAPGRLEGVSLLRSTFDALGAGAAGPVAGRLEGGGALERFDEDEFESLSGTFEIAAGRARSDDLRLVYRHYAVELWGSVGLADRSLDLAGRLTIGEAIDAALAGGEAAGSARPRVIRLARVTGTVDEPRVALSSEAVLTFASIYAADPRRREKWERKLDERLGEGAGREVLDALDEVLGGKR
jgi:uncharacterized protein YhdP